MNQPADNKKLLDFLLYSYFGCSSEDSEQTVKKMCVPRVFRLGSNGQIYLFFKKT